MRRDVFQAIADPTRRAILMLLASQSMTPNAIAEHFAMTRQAVSKHIQYLSDAEIIGQNKTGREINYHVNPDKMKEWYKTNLGLNTHEYGAVFEWHQGADNTKKGFTTWSPFKETTKYFEPSAKEFMINYRVENLEVLVEELKKNGVSVLDAIETYDYGKFVHILDAEGNKIELWEPNDIEYEKLGKDLGAETTK